MAMHLYTKNSTNRQKINHGGELQEKSKVALLCIDLRPTTLIIKENRLLDVGARSNARLAVRPWWSHYGQKVSSKSRWPGRRWLLDVSVRDTAEWRQLRVGWLQRAPVHRRASADLQHRHPIHYTHYNNCVCSSGLWKLNEYHQRLGTVVWTVGTNMAVFVMHV